MGIVPMGVILDEDFLWWGFSGWEFPGGNHLGGSFPGTYAQIDKNMLLDVKIYNLIQKAKM